MTVLTYLMKYKVSEKKYLAYLFIKCKVSEKKYLGETRDSFRIK